MAVLLNEYKKIQFLVDSLVLPFIKNNHPKWRELISTYLEYLDNNSLFKSMNVTDNVDVNEMYTELLDDFLELYFKDVVDLDKFGLNDDNKRLFISLSKLIGNLKSTKTSFGFFFNSFSDFSIPSDSGDISVNDLTIELNEKPEWWLLNNSSTRPFTYVFKIDTPELSNLKELIKRVHPAGWLQLFLFEISFHDESGMGEYMNGHDCFELDIKYGAHYNGKWNYDGEMDILGDARPLLYNGGYSISDDINCAPIPRFFGSSSYTEFDFSSAFGTEWFSPINMDYYGSGGNQHGMTIDNDNNLYTYSATQKIIYKMDGLTSRGVASIPGFPAGYESWQMQTMSWNRTTDRLCLVMRDDRYDQHWIELVGFTTEIALDIHLEYIGSGVFTESMRQLQYDAQRDLLVGISTGYSGSYHNYIITFNYSDGSLYEGGWHGKLLSYTNALKYCVLDVSERKIYIVNAYVGDDEILIYDYLAYIGTNGIGKLGSIPFNTRTIGEYGIDLDSNGDLWSSAQKTSSPYENLITRYAKISNTPYPGIPLTFASKASPAYLNHPEVPGIVFETTDPVLNAGQQSAAGELIFIMKDDQGDDYENVWGDGNFIYVANGGAGIRSYSVNGAGDLTHIDTHDQGGDYRDVWGGPAGAGPSVNLLGDGWDNEIFIDSNPVASTFTVPAGTDRCVVVYLASRMDGEDNPNLAWVNLGGKQLTKIIEENVNDRTFRSMYMWAGYLLESDIALMVGDDFTVTWYFAGQPDQGTRIGFAAYENVDQITPIGDFNSNTLVSSQTVTTGDFSYEIGDQPIIVAAAGRDSNGSFIDASEYSYGDTGGQEYGFAANLPVGWDGFLYSKTYLPDADTDNKTAEVNDACGMIAGGFVLNHAGPPNFVFATDGFNFGNGLMSYSVDGSGNLTFKDNDFQGSDPGTIGYRGVWGDGNFVYVACTGMGLRSYSVDGDGMLTHIDTSVEVDAEDYYGVWGDGTFIFVACDLDGLRTYSVDGSGILTYIDVDMQGTGGYLDVWGDGNFIYVATYDQGIRSYSVDGAGMLTYIDEDNQGGNAYSVWGDGTYVYMACRFDGIRSYYVDGTGHFTFLDVDKQDFAGYLGVWGDGDFIYAACDFDGLRSYGVTLPAPSGELIFKDGDSQSSENPKGIWANDSFVFAACSLDGLRTYSVDGAGVFTALDAHNQTPGESYNAVWSDGNYIYVGSSGDLLSYSVDGAGNLTYRHSVSALFTGYNDVCGDGTYIFSTNMGTTAGLRSHSVSDGVLTYLSNVVAGAGLSMHFDGTFIFVATATGLRSFSINSGTGATTLEDTDDQGGIYREVWGDGEFIYVQTDEGIISHSVDGSGNITFISSNPDGKATSGEAGLWGDGNFIYTGCSAEGIKSFSRDGAGNLTLVDTDDQGGQYGDVYGDGNFVYVCSSNSILSYQVI